MTNTAKTKTASTSTTRRVHDSDATTPAGEGIRGIAGNYVLDNYHHFEQVTTGAGPVDLPIVRPIDQRLFAVLDEMKRFRHELGAYSPTLAERMLEITDHFEAALS